MGMDKEGVLLKAVLSKVTVGITKAVSPEKQYPSFHTAGRNRLHQGNPANQSAGFIMEIDHLVLKLI